MYNPDKTLGLWPCSAQCGQASELHLLPGPDLKWKFDVPINQKHVSCQSCFQTTVLCFRQQMMYSGMRVMLSLTLELS